MSKANGKSRELTGRAVLFWLLGFFALVFAVNGVLVQAATSTFRGLESENAYQAGLIFQHEVASADRQDALHWHVQGTLSGGGGQTMLDIDARDAQGLPLTGITASATLAHPADTHMDRIIPMNLSGAGSFHGTGQAKPGQWELIVDLYRGDERMFRSRNRVTLK